MGTLLGEMSHETGPSVRVVFRQLSRALNRPYCVLARIVPSPCLVVACIPSSPLSFVLPLFHVNVSIACKPIANTRLGLATSSVNKAAASLNSVTFSMECPRENSVQTQAHVNV
jgi:hypothetical protein